MKIPLTLTFLLAEALIQLTWAETCQEEHDRLSEELKNNPRPGLELPSCEDDGSYKPVQCKGSECFCVADDGSTIGEYSMDRWKATDMDCLCARFVSESNIASDRLPPCLKNGNYEKMVPQAANGTCSEASKLLYKLKMSASPPLLLELPICEEDGSYKPVQYRGAYSFCVSADGSMIGYSVYIWEDQGMDCLCARFVWESNIARDRLPSCMKNGNYEKLVPETETCSEAYELLSKEKNSDSPPAGLELPICEEDGSYKPVQCRGSQCFCVSADGSMIGYSVNRGEEQGMDCLCARFTSKSNIASDSLPSCLENGNYQKMVPQTETCSEAYELLSKEKNSDSPPAGLELPMCEEDGSYKPVQCRGSQCFCVSADGSMIGYSVNRWQAQGMDCLCARFVLNSNDSDTLPTCLKNGNYQKTPETCKELHDRLSEELKNDTRLGLELPSCEDDGSYKPVQCKGSECFCVTADGSKIRDFSMDRWQATDMDCLCARAEAESGLEDDSPSVCEENGNYSNNL